MLFVWLEVSRVVGTGLATHERDGWGKLPIQEGCCLACTALPTQHSNPILAQRPLVDPCLPLSDGRSMPRVDVGIASLGQSMPQINVDRREIRPTADRGPILLCVDTSGSMRGPREVR